MKTGYGSIKFNGKDANFENIYTPNFPNYGFLVAFLQICLRKHVMLSLSKKGDILENTLKRIEKKKEVEGKNRIK